MSAQQLFMGLTRRQGARLKTLPFVSQATCIATAKCGRSGRFGDTANAACIQLFYDPPSYTVPIPVGLQDSYRTCVKAEACSSMEVVESAMLCTSTTLW